MDVKWAEVEVEVSEEESSVKEHVSDSEGSESETEDETIYDENYLRENLFELLKEQILDDIHASREIDPKILEEQERVWIQCPCDVPLPIQEKLCICIYQEAGLPIFWISPDSMVIEYFTRQELEEIHLRRKKNIVVIPSTFVRLDSDDDSHRSSHRPPRGGYRRDSHRGPDRRYQDWDTSDKTLPVTANKPLERSTPKELLRVQSAIPLKANSLNQKAEVEKVPLNQSNVNPSRVDSSSNPSNPSKADPSSNPSDLWQTQSRKKKRYIEKPLPEPVKRIPTPREPSRTPTSSSHIRTPSVETKPPSFNSTSGFQRGRNSYR
jgi:hypothetical protein